MPASGQRHPRRWVPSLINTSQIHIRIVIPGSDLGVHLRVILRRTTTRSGCALFLRWLDSPYIAIKGLFQWILIYTYNWWLTSSSMCYHLTWANRVFSGCLVLHRGAGRLPSKFFIACSESKHPGCLSLHMCWYFSHMTLSEGPCWIKYTWKGLGKNKLLFT